MCQFYLYMADMSKNSSSVIHQEIHWVTSRDEVGRSTPFSRVHRIWARVHRTAMDEPGSLRFNSLENGYIWSFWRHRQEPQYVDMRKWAAACKSAMDRFQASIKLLVFQSEGLGIQSIKIEDNKVREAPHRQTANLQSTAAAQNMLFARILENASSAPAGENADQCLRSWLAEEQKALEFLAVVLCLASGVSFRGWQLSSIRFDCSGHHNRNLWIVDGRVLVSHPKAKQWTHKYAPTLLAFPLAISSVIAYYTAIIRPTACLVLKHLGIDDLLHSTLLWSDPIPSEHQSTRRCPILPWSGQDISFRLKNFTKMEMGTPLTPMLARQISQAVIRDKFPQLFNQPTLSATLANYAHHCDFPHWTDLGPDIAVQILAVAQIWQAMLNLETVTKNSPWLSVVESCQIFPNDMVKNWEVTFFKATRVLETIGANNIISLSNKEVRSL